MVGYLLVLQLRACATKCHHKSVSKSEVTPFLLGVAALGRLLAAGLQVWLQEHYSARLLCAKIVVDGLRFPYASRKVDHVYLRRQSYCRWP